jgi:hypothetical protein
MRKVLSLGLVVACALSAAGCNTPQGQNAAGGAIVGGAGGALLGAAVTGGKPGGAIVGGVLGAATGAMVGSAMTPSAPPRQCAQVGYDYYGNQICQAYY